MRDKPVRPTRGYGLKHRQTGQLVYFSSLLGSVIRFWQDHGKPADWVTVGVRVGPWSNRKAK